MEVPVDIAYSILMQVDNLKDLKSLGRVSKNYNRAFKLILVDTRIYEVKSHSYSFHYLKNPHYTSFKNFKEAAVYYFSIAGQEEEGYFNKTYYFLYKKYTWKNKIISNPIIPRQNVKLPPSYTQKEFISMALKRKNRRSQEEPNLRDPITPVNSILNVKKCKMIETSCEFNLWGMPCNCYNLEFKEYDLVLIYGYLEDLGKFKAKIRFSANETKNAAHTKYHLLHDRLFIFSKSKGDPIFA
jgi:hypothetical protein